MLIKLECADSTYGLFGHVRVQATQTLSEFSVPDPGKVLARGPFGLIPFAAKVAAVTIAPSIGLICLLLQLESEPSCRDDRRDYLSCRWCDNLKCQPRCPLVSRIVFQDMTSEFMLNTMSSGHRNISYY